MSGDGQAMAAYHAQQDAVIDQLKNALVAAMEEVDTLRNQMFSEQGKIQREFRETVDLLVHNNKIDVSGASAANTTTNYNASLANQENQMLRGRMESLEAAVRQMQAQQAPLTMDKVLTQTKTFLEQTDKEVESIRLNMEEKMRWVDSKMSEVAAAAHTKDLRLQEQFDRFQSQQTASFDDMVAAMRRRETQFVAQQQQQSQALLNLTTAGSGLATEIVLPPEIELRMAQLAKLSAAVDKRVMMSEESIAQLDAEQRDLVTSIQSLRAAMQAEKIRNSQTRTSGTSGVMNEGPMGVALTVVTVRDEVIRVLENEQINRNRQIKEEIIAIRADVQKTLGQVDRNAGDVTRIANQYQGVQQSLTRVESHVAAMQERLEGEMKGQFARAEVSQKAFFARQDQLLANERHQIATKLSADIQQLQQKSLQEHQSAEIRRTDDIRASHAQLRDDFNRFVSDQRLEVEKTHASLRDYVNHQTKEQGDILSKQFREVTDDTRRAMINSMDDVRKLAARTSEELKRIKGSVDDNTQRLSEQHQYLHNRVQQILDEEVKRFDRLAEDSRLRLAQQIESEVVRAVGATEGSLVRAYHSIKEQQEREGRLMKEELEAIRGSLAAVAAPSTTMAAFESRVDSLRKDMTQLHVNFSRFVDFESKITNTLTFELRKSNDQIKGEVLRDVGSQLQRFDRALTDLSTEQQAQYVALSQQAAIANASYSQQQQQQLQRSAANGMMPSPISHHQAPQHHQQQQPSSYSTAAAGQYLSQIGRAPSGGFRMPSSRSGTPAAAGIGGNNSYAVPSSSQQAQSIQYDTSAGGLMGASMTADGGRMIWSDPSVGPAAGPNNTSTASSARFSPDRSHVKDLFGPSLSNVAAPVAEGSAASRQLSSAASPMTASLGITSDAAAGRSRRASTTTAPTGITVTNTAGQATDILSLSLNQPTDQPDPLAGVLD